MQVAPQQELDAFIQKHPDVTMLEVLMPDMSGTSLLTRIMLPRPGQICTKWPN